MLTLEQEIQMSKIPVYVITTTVILLISLWSYQEHNYARRDREAAMLQRDRTAIIEDRVRDEIVGSSIRPLVIYYVGEDEWGDEVLINWPLELERWLGWTREDIELQGLEVMIPDDEELEHLRIQLKSLEVTSYQVITSYLHAVKKDGEVIPVRISSWGVGDGTRALAAYIEKAS